MFGLPQLLDLPLIEREFGADIARIVESMRKLRRLREISLSTADPAAGAARADRSAQQQLETLRRMLLAMSVDVRVVLLRLASRLQTLRRHTEEKTTPPTAVCQETLEVLAPLANRLGVGALKWQLEDLAFRFLEPQFYAELARGVHQKRTVREAQIEKARLELTAALAAEHIGAQIHGRSKHLYSLARKMRRKGLRLDQVHDLQALRVVVTDVPACYRALDVVHTLWSPRIDQFADYISAPKSNGYQSLHTVVNDPSGTEIEVQIRTAKMDEAAEYGGAAHWQYKEGVPFRGDGGAAGGNDGFEQRVSWLRQLLDWQREIGHALGAATASGQPDSTVYALTPQGRVIALPSGATPIDFAYHLHTDLGHSCRGARVNGAMVPLTRPLQSGDTVEIISAKGQAAGAAGPSRDWLNTSQGYLASHRARNKVRQWFAAREGAREQQAGRAIVEKAIQHVGAGTVSLERLADHLRADSPSHLFTMVFKAEIGPRAIEQALRELKDGPLDAPAASEPAPAPRTSRPAAPVRGDTGVLVEGVGSLLTQLARCCHPVPPDPIAGFITQGKGITIHRDNCRVFRQIRERAPERTVAAQWSDQAGAGGAAGPRAGERNSSQAAAKPRYPVELEVRGGPAAGLLQTVADVLAREQVPLLTSQALQRAEHGLVRVTVALNDARALPALLARLQQAPGVSTAARR